MCSAGDDFQEVAVTPGGATARRHYLRDMRSYLFSADASGEFVPRTPQRSPRSVMDAGLLEHVLPVSCKNGHRLTTAEAQEVRNHVGLVAAAMLRPPVVKRSAVPNETSSPTAAVGAVLWAMRCYEPSLLHSGKISEATRPVVWSSGVECSAARAGVPPIQREWTPAGMRQEIFCRGDHGVLKISRN
mmetsp:Transcript_12103/g.26988  ORF Transcript_12103/g.26988 Transcript_12103/m.26988 type:complete len:187 (+) Transcript_12103:246-806(+)